MIPRFPGSQVPGSYIDNGFGAAVSAYKIIKKMKV
jgi:NCAIR mutase (PurE)-related protein